LAGGCDRGGVVMDCQLIRWVRMARNAEISRLRGTSIAFALFSIKRFSLIDYFWRSRGYCGLLSSICHDYNYRLNEELQLRSILPYHDTTYPLPELGLYYLHLRRYVYPGWQTPRRRMKGGDTSFRGGKGRLSADEGVTLYLVRGE
jgi:hypothetical protein